MDSILRAAAVYFFLLVIFRISGKRTLSEATTFDFILLLIIAETTQQALLGSDNSLTQSALLITTLVGIDIALSLLKQRLPTVERWVDDLPLVLLQDGKPIAERLRMSRVDEDDILEAARLHQGLERLDQIKFAVLERSGGITIVPKQDARS